MKTNMYSTQESVLSWRNMLNSLVESRELILRFMYRDLSVRYKQSYLGYLWILLPQLVTAVTFTYIAKYRVFDISNITMPYVLFVLWNVSLWQLFSSALLHGTNSLFSAGAMINKVRFPKETLVIASIGQPILDFVIRMIPIIFAMFWFNYFPSVVSLLPILFIVLVIIFLALGISLFLAPINLIFRDLGNALAILLTLGIFLAPILYPPPTTFPLSLLNQINPFSPLLISTQNLLSGQAIAYPVYTATVSFISLLLALLGWRFLVTIIPKISERA